MADLMFMHMRRRRNIRRERVFRDHKNPIDIFGDVELYERFRFRRNDILGIVDEIQDDIKYPATRQGSLPAVLQLLITLRFYATGCFQNTVGEMIGIIQPTASRTIHQVTNAIRQHMDLWVHLPTQHEADQQKVKFLHLACFPNVWGCILTVFKFEFKRPP